MISDVPESGPNERSYDEFADTHSDFSIFVDRLEEISF